MDKRILAFERRASILRFMTLREWMTKREMTQREAADALGISQAEICMYLGGRAPSLLRAWRFEQRTSGELKMADLIPEDMKSPDYQQRPDKRRKDADESKAAKP